MIIFKQSWHLFYYDADIASCCARYYSQRGTCKFHASFTNHNRFPKRFLKQFSKSNRRDRWILTIRALRTSRSVSEDAQQSSSLLDQSSDPPPKPGSAAELFQLLKTHEKNWKKSRNRSKQRRHHAQPQSSEDLDRRQRFYTLRVTEAFSKAETKLSQGTYICLYIHYTVDVVDAL